MGYGSKVVNPLPLFHFNSETLVATRSKIWWDLPGFLVFFQLVELFAANLFQKKISSHGQAVPENPGALMQQTPRIAHFAHS